MIDISPEFSSSAQVETQEHESPGSVLLPLSPHLFAPPCHDPKYMRLPEEAQVLVDQRLSAMKEISTARKKAKAIRDIAQRHDGEAGWSVKNITMLWYSFLRIRNWTCLLNKALAGPAWWETADVVGLPQEFREHLGQEWVLRQRGKFAQVWKDLKTQYKAWRSGDKKVRIPGYSAPPDALPSTGLPLGWTYENLKRIADSEATIYERTLIAIGPKAASQFTPKTRTTRVGLEVGQLIMPDDCWVDFSCLYRGSRSRLLSLHILDVASGCNVLRGYLPTHEDEKGVEQRIKEKDMVFLFQHYFCAFGFHPDGTLIAAEKATATLRASEQNLLHELSGGTITVNTGPAGGGPGISGLFAARGGGNPRWKANIESFFNLWHNATDHMLQFPGQLGSNSRINCPEGFSKMAAHDEALARCQSLLPPEKRDLIQFGLLQHHDAVLLLDAKTEWCNCRADHDLNQWRECGNIIPSFRLSEQTPWLPATLISQLDDDQKAHLKVLLASNPNLSGEMVLSPRQVFEAGREKLRRFTLPQAAKLLKETVRTERPVERGQIEYFCPEVDPDEPIPYGPILRDCRGTEIALNNSDKYAVTVNPLNPEIAFLFGPKMEWIGYVTRTIHGRKDDPASLMPQIKANAKAMSHMIENARKLGSPITKEFAARTKNNTRVFKEVETAQNDLAAAADAALLRSQT